MTSFQTMFCLVLLVSSLQVFANSINVYSFREAKLIAPIVERFSSETGIQVNVVSGKAGKLMKRLEEDGTNSFADLLLTTNVARLDKAKSLGLLQAVQSEYLDQHVPDELKDPQGHWFGISMRARAIFYAKQRINANEIKDYSDLLAPKWQGKVCTRTGSHIYNRAMIASFVYRHGKSWTADWVNGLVNNLSMRPNGGDRDQLRNINKELCDIALANSYYYGMMSQSEKQLDREVYRSVGVIWPNQTLNGTHVNISGAAVTNSAKNKQNAIKFIEFLLTKEAQAMYSEINHEIPVREDIAVGELLRSWGEFKADKKSIKNLSPYLPTADMIIQQAKW